MLIHEKKSYTFVVFEHAQFNLLAKRNSAGIFSLFAAFAVLLSGCDHLWPDVQWRKERYVVMYVDTLSEMSLAFDYKDGNCLGLVGPTVFSIGSNEKYIVVKAHPNWGTFRDKFDRSITNYYVVDVNSSDRFEDRKKGVHGPMTKEEFDKLAISLSLPPFTKTFDDLK